MKKKPPHILHVFDGFRCGGTELRTCRVINCLKGKYRHTICSINGNFDASSHLDPSVQVTLVHPKTDGQLYPFQLFYIYRALVKIKPDLMIAYAWGAIDWLIANSFIQIFPSIHAAEGFDESEIFFQKPHRELIRRMTLQRCNKIVTCSRLLENMAGGLWKLEKKKIVHIPNGINLEQFSCDITYKKKSVDTIHIGIVASLIKLKNHARLIRCFSKINGHKKLILHIAGDGPESAVLMKMCNQLGISKQVLFLGHVNDPSILLKDLDIFCLSSDVEQMPIAVLEAMACGLPIVGTDVGDIKEMVSSGNRVFIVNRGKENAYFRALETLVNNKELRAKIGYDNRKKCHQFFSEKLMVDHYEQIYNAALGGACF